MWIVAIAWMYVALMMSMAEATSPQGTVLGAVITFLFYGVGPLALVMYLLGTPARRRALRQKEAEARAQQMAASAPTSAASTDTDASGLPPGDAVTPEGKKP